MKNQIPFIAFALAAFLWGCSREDEHHGHVHGASCNHGGEQQAAEDAHEHEHEGQAIRVPQNTQKLIGLTCVTAEKRSVQGTVRFPGRFEVKPSARRVYSAIFEGVVQAHVRPYQRVEEGDVLFRLVSPAWIQQSGQHRDAEAALTLARTEAQVVSERLDNLRKAGGRNAELDMTLKLKSAEAERAEVAFQNAVKARQAVLTYTTEEEGALVVKARDGGIVERIEIGAKECPPGACDCGGAEAWVPAGAEIVSVVREDGVWFRADGMLSELTHVRNGQYGFVTPARSAAGKAEGVLTVAWSADADMRTRPLYLTLDELPAWAQPGVPGVLSVVVEDAAEGAVAVPLSCVVEDGLERIVFVRDEHDDGTFIRTEVTLGASDGEWVEVSGVEAGAEVVLHGAYELKLAMPAEDGTGAKPKAAGHFHADGVFHEGTH
jgi:hypothetical protein